MMTPIQTQTRTTIQTRTTTLTTTAAGRVGLESPGKAPGETVPVRKGTQRVSAWYFVKLNSACLNNGLSLYQDDESETDCNGISVDIPVVNPSMVCELGEMNKSTIDPDIERHDSKMVSRWVIFLVHEESTAQLRVPHRL